MAPRTVMRMCAVTRTEAPAEDLLRFALGPENEILPDVDAKAPGRGVWVSLSRRRVEEAVAKNVFAKSLKQGVNLPPDLAQMVRTRLEQRLLGGMGLARKAGQLLTGAEKVKAALLNKSAIALFTASDAAEDGRQKMRGAAKAAFGEAGLPHYEFLSSMQMNLALGQENVIHAALTKGAAAQSALLRAKKLARYEHEDDDRI